ncbi:class I SAM-dependent methyltransferase [Natribaculum luteum]|uniref:Class I SAM-dependent methyltransferase n=1 Tax=Natribaculum luteum TaxID=1586232 RepID=A0ABD5P4U4_9EURY|nr:methyltransferase domain-containing protein [Natribaculum luteum]
MSLLEAIRSDADAARRYDRIAPYYDRYVSWFERGPLERLVTALDLEQGETLLDVGCGPGSALVALGDRVGPEGVVIGLDVSGRMIDLARDRLETRGFGDRALLIHGDARDMRHVDDDSVDAVVLSFTLELFSREEMRTVLAECRRVLVPDGRLGVLSLSREDRLSVAVYDRFHRLAPGVFDCRPIDLPAVLERHGFAVRSVWTERLYGLPVSGAIASIDD